MCKRNLDFVLTYEKMVSEQFPVVSENPDIPRKICQNVTDRNP